MMRRTILIASALTLLSSVAAACGDGTFTAEDLPDIVLQASDVPPEYPPNPELTGPENLQDYSAEERRQLREAGFLAGHHSNFGADVSENPPFLGIVSIAYLFDSPEGAAQWFEASRDRFAEVEGLREISAEGLGDEGAAWRGPQEGPQEPLFGSVYVWRRGSLVLFLATVREALLLSGDEVRALAETMDSRAA